MINYSPIFGVFKMSVLKWHPEGTVMAIDAYSGNILASKFA